MLKFKLYKTFLLLIISLCCSIVLCSALGDKDLDVLREKMVKTQIKARGVSDKRVIKAMGDVERHKFVPDRHLTEAYDDHPLPIGYEQTISQPYIVALMSELCELDGNEKVLEIGTGSGYQAAILSLLAREVFSIEIIEPLGKSAAKRLKTMKYNNVFIKTGDGYMGWPDHAPFDVIILTASPPLIPDTLIKQLKENGIMVAPVGEFYQELIKIKKINGKIIKKSISSVRFVPMVHGK